MKLSVRRSSTWGSRLDQVNRARKINNLYSSNTIDLASANHESESYNSTSERGELLRGRTEDSAVNVDGNDEEKQCMLTKNDEKLGHGFFEDEELVNVVQNLVNSRYI